MSIRKKWGREIAEMKRAYMLQSKVQPDPLWKEEKTIWKEKEKKKKQRISHPARVYNVF
jgi:hypothetical protein